MTQDSSAAGDYGYDLAHQEPGGTAGSGRPGEREPVGPSPAVGKPGLEDDFGYDQAHDF